MDIIGEYFYVIILIIGALAQWMKSRSESKAEAEEMRKRQERGGEEYYDPEEIEEWSAPRPAVPPPLPAAEIAPAPSHRRSGSTPPPVSATNIESELQRQAALAEQMRLLKESRKPAKRDGASAAKERSGHGRVREMDLPAGASLRQRLGNNRELKNAFVLKEILEKPVGLR